MQAPWWEGISDFLCKFWWIVVLILALALILFFTRDYWMPAIGL